MTRPDLAELRRLAEAVDGLPTGWYEQADEEMTRLPDDDAAYIAAASPDVILALLDELEAKR